MTTQTEATAAPTGFPRIVSLLLNIAHGIDHMFLLIFATAVATIAVEFGYTQWASRCWCRTSPIRAP